MYIIKRSGEEEEFTEAKLYNAIQAANNDVGCAMSLEEVQDVVTNVTNEILTKGYSMSVEEIQDKVEEQLMRTHPYVARAYVRYRYDREKVRQGSSIDDQIMAIVNCTSEEAKQENSNKNPVLLSCQRDYIAGTVSKDIARRVLYPSEVIEAHDSGKIHVHDMDYAVQHMFNCCLVNLKDMFENGTVISGTLIETPRKFSVACTIATQIVSQISSNQYGGQTISLAHLAPYVQKTREKYRAVLSEALYGKDLDEMVEKLVLDDVKQGCQTIQYQLITLLTTNGQAAFCSLDMNINDAPEGQEREDLILIIKEILRQRIKGVKNPEGVYVAPAFPKLLYHLDENNIYPDSLYYDVTRLAEECTAERMVPDTISNKKLRELKGGEFGCMGCRSWLAPWRDMDGNPKWWGRFNQGVCTINLPYVALESIQTGEPFMEALDKALELCHTALRTRHEYLEGTPSDVSPIHFQYGGIARLKPGEKIDRLLHNGYSTISLGYAGLWECVKAITGSDMTDPEGEKFGLYIMDYMNYKTEQWNNEHYIGYSLYGTPLESTTYTFAKALKKFPEIKDVNDHIYITNSYHINVRKEIDAFSKLKFEAAFQEKSLGGCISYVETPKLTDNLDAVDAVYRFNYEEMLYAEMNTRIDHCRVCGSNQDMKLEKRNGKLTWVCPFCGNDDFTLMNVARRVCGYISTNDMNQGRLGEIADRVLHL